MKANDVKFQEELLKALSSFPQIAEAYASLRDAEEKRRTRVILMINNAVDKIND